MSDRPSVSLSIALPRAPAPRAAGKDRRQATPERGLALRAGLLVAGLGGMDWRNGLEKVVEEATKPPIWH